MDLEADYTFAPIASKIFLTHSGTKTGLISIVNTLHNICHAVEAPPIRRSHEIST